ncbi:hypothetical protein ACS0TY_011114 [Phlomoides rotata]
MNQNAFDRLCIILRNRGVWLTEHILALKSKLRCFKKNHVVKFNHQRSGQTISHYMHAVLLSVLKMHIVLFVRPEPVPSDSTNPRWKWFKGCLGVIDDTYISVHVPEVDKGIYRMRKGTISTNVLVACDCNYNCMFTYILPGWEGSASDARVLRDFISKVHGLKVPIGIYYLCDNGYANSPGFLSPYHSVRYHLTEVLFDNSESGQDESAEIPDVISTIELTTEWTGWRDTLAQKMFQEFMDGV